jgi:hypothetical protein
MIYISKMQHCEKISLDIFTVHLNSEQVRAKWSLANVGSEQEYQAGTPTMARYKTHSGYRHYLRRAMF